MRYYTTIPSRDEILADVLNTTLRPSKAMPSVLSLYGPGGHKVLANVAHLRDLHVDAGAVYLVPPRRQPHRSPKPGELVLVTATWARLPGGAFRLEEGRRVIHWCVGLVGELDPDGWTDPAAQLGLDSA